MFVKYKVNIMLILGYSPLKSGTKNIFSVKKNHWLISFMKKYSSNVCSFSNKQDNSSSPLVTPLFLTLWSTKSGILILTRV